MYGRAGAALTARHAYEILATDEHALELVADRAGLPRARALAALERMRRWTLAIATPTGWRRRLQDV